MKKKLLSLLPVIALVACASVAATLAWLKSETDPVVNTFTAGDVKITLAESNDLNLQMVPGTSLKKDPKVTVEAGSEESWLFVQPVESADLALSDFITYEIDSGWTQGDGDTVPATVWYRQVDAVAEDAATPPTFSILKDDQVLVKETATRRDFNLITETNAPSLTFRVWAIQQDNLSTPGDAWTALSGTPFSNIE